MVQVHPTAVVDPKAELAEGVVIEAYAIVEAGVRIGARTQVGAHALITGLTQLGVDNRVHANAILGTPPQDKKYAHEPTRLEIGDRNTFREFVTVNTGPIPDQGLTRIGDDNWIMAYVHIAHDCLIGNHVTLANCTQLGGHVQLGDWVTLGGFTGVHQFCKVGAHVMTSVGTTILQDVPPYLMCAGQGASPHGLNSEGLSRRGFDRERIAVLKRAYRLLYRQGHSLEQARREITELAAATESPNTQDLQVMLEFLARVTRGIVR